MLERLVPQVASARSLPARTLAAASVRVSNISCTRPLIRSTRAVLPVLYGTWTISAPLSDLNNSPAKCSMPPLPLEA